MSEGFVQLPTDGGGKQFRTQVGDPSNAIPSGEHTEVVIESDAQGFFSGDPRQKPLAVTEQTMQEVLLELRRLTLVCAIGFGVDVPSAVDADSITLTKEGASR